MRKYLHINLADRSVETEELEGEAIVRVGRHFIARTLLERGAAGVDPLSPDNPLIFSAGPFAGTNFSNANRISIGCKSPLTGGVKEANAGGSFAFALGQLEIAGFTLTGASDDWAVIYIPKEGPIRFDSAEPYLGKGNFEAAALLFEKYGEKVSLAICGPVGEYQGLMAGIAFTDPEGRPERIAARGGVGAVMGAKKIKAIVAEKHKMPPFHDRKKVMTAVREYGAKLGEEPAVKNMSDNGTAFMADVMNHMGGLPVRNFRDGRLVDTSKGTMRMGGEFIREQNMARGGETTHACMPGCMIKCSNVYVDAAGKEIVSPLEYETIGLMGTNCGLTDPDDVARMNALANDLGIDTIEAGATLALLMDHGEAEFGDLAFMEAALEDVRRGSERGRLLAQGAAHVGAHYGVARVPVVKRQAISAYDPRAIEVTGITMMLTPQGADHTAGNLPAMDCKGKTTEELTEASLGVQVNAAIADSLGLCLFGRSVTDAHHQLIIDALNDAHGTAFGPDYLKRLGRETLELEMQFNEAAGFTEGDDELPAFFYAEPLAPTDKVARHHAGEVNQARRAWLVQSAG